MATDARRRRAALLVAYVTLVVLPLAALAWMSSRLARAEVARANARVADLAAASLRGTGAAIGALVETRRQAIGAALVAGTTDEPGLRRLRRELPGVRQTFHRSASGQLAYPSPGGELDREEADFLRRTARLWTEDRLAVQTGESDSEVAAVTNPGAASGKLAPPPPEGNVGTWGWHPWHQDDGLHLLCWWRRPDGAVVGAELDRIRLLGDLVAELPDADPALADGRLRLLDAEGRVLHQWGRLDPRGREPVARVAVPSPLSAWSLEYFDPGRGDGSGAGRAALLSGAVPWLAGLGAVVLILAVHVFRESTRELRDAETRVSFVNQVSHELKTPLTNIRMYAELLADEVADEPVPARYAGIVAGESQRLSRLIGNVLAFARQERRELALHLRTEVVDEVVRRVVETFRPSLAARGITIDIALAAPRPCRFDADALEQILGNLLSNVEKYGIRRASQPTLANDAAANVGRAVVRTTQDVDRVRLTVEDSGPGIPPAHRERIFAPFARVSNALTDGVSGAGLGLTIARELARLHGGDLRLVSAGSGATFEATLAVAPADDADNEPGRSEEPS